MSLSIETSTVVSQEDFPETPEYAALVFLSIFILQGVLGNSLVIISVATDKKLRSYIDAMVVNVALLDLIVTGFVLPTTFPHLLDSTFEYTGGFCDFIGFISTSTCIGSLVSLTFVAVNKYVYICHNHLYKRIFTKVTVGVIIVCTWVYGMLIAVPIVLPTEFGDVWFSRAVATCVLNMNGRIGYMAFLLVFGLWIFIFITYFSYGKISWKLYKSRQNIAVGTKGSLSQKKYLQVYTMFAVSALFTFSWLPYCIASYWAAASGSPPFMFTRVATWMGSINSCLNFIVLGSVNKNYKAAYKNVLCCCCKKASGKVGTISRTVWLSTSDG